MLQATYDRATKLGQVIYVVTEKSHADHVQNQLPGLDTDNLIIEPGRRGTAHCITMALDYVARRHDHNEPIAFIHADHHIRDVEGFIRSFEIAANVSKKNKEIVLIGVEPTYPSTGLGYIERDGIVEGTAGVYKVESFKEKPDFKIARKYLASGRYLWNCGYFVGSVNIFLNEIKHSAPNLDEAYRNLSNHELGSKEYDRTYLALGNEVIDIALIEKTRSLAVVSAQFDWMDIGSFKDLHDAVELDEMQNYFRGDSIHTIDVENVYIRNEESKPIAVIGMDNVVVVNTPDGIVVARKDISHRIGEIAKEIQAQDKK